MSDPADVPVIPDTITLVLTPDDVGCILRHLAEAQLKVVYQTFRKIETQNMEQWAAAQNKKDPVLKRPTTGPLATEQ